MHKVSLVPLADAASTKPPAWRPSLFDLWQTYEFQSGRLAIAAKVPPGTVQAMLCNEPIGREHAHRILTALSALLGKEYTLQSVYAALLEEEHC